MRTFLTCFLTRRGPVLTATLTGVAIIVSAVVAYAAWRGAAPPSPTPSPPGHDEATSYVVETPSARVQQAQLLEPLPRTADPKSFARQVANALFAFDTSTVVTRADHVAQLVAVADPTGESAPGLVSDLDNYLPTPQAWTQLAQYETRQWLVVDSVTIPTKWPEALAQAGDELLPGTSAFTIQGTRHRAGTWEDEPVASEHDVAFTVFIVCGPTYPQCHLLRLSLLDQPLE